MAASAQLDRLQRGLVELAEHFDRYFPGLETHPQTVHGIYELLSARVSAANARTRLLSRAPLELFVNAQLAEARLRLEDQVDTDEAADVFVFCADELYMWLRRHDVIEPERSAVAVIGRRGEQVLAGTRPGPGGAPQWGFASGPLEPGESVEDTACRAFAADTGLQLDEVICRVAYSYDYLAESDSLCLTVFVLADCADSDLQPNGAWRWCDWDALPRPLAPELAGVAGMMLPEPALA